MTGESGRVGWWGSLARAVAVGIVLGGTNSLSSAFGSQYGPWSLSADGVVLLEVLAALLGTEWGWCLGGFAAGFWAGRPGRGAVAGVLALLVADATYYTSDWLLQVNDDFALPELKYWGVLAVVAGALFGALGGLARPRAWWALVPALAAPGVMLVKDYAGGSAHIDPWPERARQGLLVLLVLWVVWRAVLVWRARRAIGGPHS